MEQGAKKQVQLSDRVYTKLKTDKERPKSATLKDSLNHVAPKLEEAFSRFWAVSVLYEIKSVLLYNFILGSLQFYEFISTCLMICLSCSMEHFHVFNSII